MGIATVTVAFTDLVGSTALLSRVGGERAEALRREHFALLRAAIGPCGGREIKNLGDGLMVLFPSAADAVTAGVAVQRAFARRNRRAAEPLLVRVGISSGDADVEGGDYFGVPVVEAARLCAAADGGEVLMTELVRLLAGSRGGHTFTPVGELELKGLDRPVAAHRIEWQPDDGAPAPPLPARLAASRTTTFAGRDGELERLGAAWKAVDGDAPVQVILLSGEPGIGKSTLSARFAASVNDEGAAVLYGRCDEELGIPYQPWVEAMSQLVSALPDDVLRAHVAERGGSVATLVPGLRVRLSTEVHDAGDQASERFVLFGCVVDLLARASEARPVLVVLDDLHGADRPTVQLLRHLATSGEPMRVGILGTFRDSDVGHGHPFADLLAALHREGRAERIELHGFSAAELLCLLERIAGHEMSADGVALRDAVLAETDGNPFFTVEVLRHLAETGVIRQGDDGRWDSSAGIGSVGLPMSVREVVTGRLARLGADSGRVLSLAAVVGREFDVPLLAAVAGIDEDALIDLCDAAVAAAVLDTTDEADRYTFVHALIAHTLYDALSPARRARVHRSVAERLESLVGDDPGGRAGELARHWSLAAGPADAAKAVHYAALAGARALGQLAPDEALRWYSEALDLIDRHGGDARRRAEILLGLGRAQRQCGRAEHRETLLAAARLADRIDSVDLLVRAALANARGFHSNVGHTDDERTAVIDRALERLGDADPAARGRLLALGALERAFTGGLDERLARTGEAVATARRSGDMRALFGTLVWSHQAVTAPETLSQRVAWSEEKCRIADGFGDPLSLSLAYNQRMVDALSEGDGPTLRSCAGVYDDATGRIPDAGVQWNSRFYRVWRAVLAGELDEAERQAAAAWAFGEEAGQPDAFTIFGAQFANIRLHQGRLHELIPEFEERVADTPGLPVYRAVLADAYARGGDRRAAVDLLETDRAAGLPMLHDVAWLTAHAEWADAAAVVGDAATAGILRERIAPYHAQIVNTSATINCSVAHYLGLLDHALGRHDDADRWFEEAMTVHERMESSLLVAYTDAAWAALLADRPHGADRRRARAMAGRAVEIAGARGFGYIEADARAVLDRLG